MTLPINVLTFFQIKINHDWELHGRVLEFLERRVNEALCEWNHTLEQKALLFSEELPPDTIADIFSDEYFDQMQFKTIVMNSFFSASFTLFESHLLEICKEVQTRYKSPFSMKDLKGSSSIDRTKAYFNGMSIPFPNNSQEWGEICRYREIRNCLVHEGGSFLVAPQLKNFNKYTGLASYAKDKGIVSADRIDSKVELLRIKITRTFCEAAFKDFEKFLLKLYRAYRDSLDA